MDTKVELKICVPCFHKVISDAYTFTERKHEKNICCALCCEMIDSMVYYDMKFNVGEILQKLVSEKEKLIAFTEIFNNDPR